LGLRGSGKGAERLTLVLISLCILAYVTAITMVAPLLLDLSRELGVPLGEAGLLAGAISLPWALGAPLTGLLSDRWGRKPLIVLALAGMGAATIVASFATSFATLLLARFAAGVFGAFGPASVMAAVADVFPPNRRGMAMGWLNAGFGLAAVAGVPAVGIVGGLLGWRWAFAVTGLALLLLSACVQLGFPSLPATHTGSSLRQTYAEVLGVPRLGNVLTANLLERSIFNATVLYLPPFLMLN
jgi:predicted MFS family arabinose efflux permease